MAQIKTLNGFRDFLPHDCAVRNYIFSVWRETAKQFGFVEYEVPLLEQTELYLKKSGGEIAGQLFRFKDQGGRDVSMRPEVTPSLARLVVAKQREFQKPMKWFQMGQCFRYERPQKGRLREFYQYNVDLIGESSLQADIELIGLSVTVMRAFGFGKGDFVVRLSNRVVWEEFCEKAEISTKEEVTNFLSVIDKWEKLSTEKLAEQLTPFKVTVSEVEDFLETGAVENAELQQIKKGLDARGLGDYVNIDLKIVRGLAYYTGTIFEVFDLRHKMRAIAGGGRYDELINTLSEGSINLPVIGFGMGDVVLRNLITMTPKALIKMEGAIREDQPCDAYVIITSEESRENAGVVTSALRQAKVKTDFPLGCLKVGKQFQRAEQLGARLAIIIGSEFPLIQVKNLNEKTQLPLEYGVDFGEQIKEMLSSFDVGILV